jgi:hypothetical protein
MSYLLFMWIRRHIGGRACGPAMWICSQKKLFEFWLVETRNMRRRAHGISWRSQATRSTAASKQALLAYVVLFFNSKIMKVGL